MATKCKQGINDVATTDPHRVAFFVDPEVATRLTRGSNSIELFQCLTDPRHPRWSARVRRVVSGGGCPTCAGKRVAVGVNDVGTTDPHQVGVFLDPGRATKLIRGSHSREWFQCLGGKSHPNWKTEVRKVVIDGNGCPLCAKFGFNSSSPAVFYILDAGTHIVFGITGNLRRRLQSYDNSRNLLHHFDFANGVDAQRIESEVKRQFVQCRYSESDRRGEVVESLTLGCLDDLLAFINLSIG